MADGRIVLEFLPAGMPASPRADTLLVVGAGTPPGPAAGWAGIVVARPGAMAFTHQAGCQCCLPRGNLAGLLGDIFRQRATGGLKWFTHVAVLPPPGQEAAWRASVAGDVLAQARFCIKN
ncbi:hypothetical protein HNW77_09250 [Komagataeibacter sp. AV436]|uniref:Uncharacterized protein n=2 Tax=Komagataeibacter melomenusus TaxID=2766578 RepID=A0ABX2AFJ8_9PROT|nr:hypothetical protein [Komagataeibacter melomenusus]MBV1830597.1 hypothetical protein [Komagataeibacter melomenusus]NPC66576.1 hypothetical protein [Komagataeibacter melomenusus]